MGLTDRVQAAWGALTTSARGGAILPLAFDEWVSYFNFNQNIYGVPALNQTLGVNREEDIDGTYDGFITQAYKRNAIVAACMDTRRDLFNQVEFQFQQLLKGTPGDLFSTPTLDILKQPSPNQTTADLLSRMIQDADLAGNWYGARRGNRIKRMRPNWVTIVLGSEGDPTLDARDIDAEIIGYIYHPGGRHSGLPAEVLLPETVAHFAPKPDPQAMFRGMSWLTPIIREVMADSAATSHKLTFFENGATPNMVVALDKDIALQAFNDWVAAFKKQEPRGFDAYKTLYLGAGATATVVGKDLQQIDFKVTQGAGETRIAGAAGVHPVVVGLSEGLAGSSLNAGNFQAAVRLTADKTIRPLWQKAAGALASIIDVPSASRLWYDDRRVPFLKEDVKDSANVQQIQSQAIKTLTDAGFTPESVIDAITAGDFERLEHTGLYSVQLQPPMTSRPEPASVPAPPATPPTEAPANA